MEVMGPPPQATHLVHTIPKPYRSCNIRSFDAQAERPAFPLHARSRSYPTPYTTSYRSIMPPTRGTSSGGITKPMKTERTHEENQERAYIAASRRSDRSLEARIESARRASEIHKKRTGRALKVTEQDVLNEEMYEEEDDDLPAQYRRLQAHLSGGFPFANHRFESYMLSNLAMRQAMMNNYTNPGGPMSAPYANPPVFSNNFSPQQMQHNYSPTAGAAHSPNTNYRSAPYPQAQQYKPMMHGRSASIAHPMSNYSNLTSPTTPGVPLTEEQRRMSLPVRPNHANSPSASSHHSAQRPTLSRSGSIETNGSTPHTAALFDSPHTTSTASMPSTTAQSYAGFMPNGEFDGSQNPFGYRADPLTPSLPLNQQQILSAVPGFENYFNTPNFSNNFSYPQYNAPMPGKPGQQVPTSAAGMMTGMNQTLSGNPLGLTIPPQHMMMAAPNMGGYTASPTSALSLPSQEMQGSGWLTPFGQGPGVDGGFDFGDHTLFGHPSGGLLAGPTAEAGGDDYGFANFVNDD